jgi:cytochrome c oxidase assembly factor CtaG
VNAPSASSFTFEPLFLALGVVGAVAYGLAARRERPAWWRIALFALGLALIVGALNSPLETIAVHYLLLVHLLQNVMIADWAPPLLILGLTPAMRRAVARRGGAAVAWVTQPKVALPAWLVGWYGIHLSVFYDFALRNAWALNVEHALLIAIGLLFWWPVLSAAPHDVSTPVKIGYLGAAFVGSAFLGLGLTFSDAPFYDFYEAAPRLWGLSPSQDQNFGGILMNAEQAAVFLAAILYFVVRLIPDEEHTSRQA